MVDAASSILFALGPRGHVLRWNGAAAALTGISADEICGRLFHETALFPDNGRHWKRQFDRVSSACTAGNFESCWRIHDSSLAAIACSCVPVCDSSGVIQYVVCTGARSPSHDFASDRAAEMRAISRYLHDTVSQDLVAASFAVGILDAAASAETLRADFESASRAIDRCCRDIRAISSVLAPPFLNGGALDLSIEDLAAVVREETGISVALDIEPVSEAVPAEAQLLLLTVAKCWVARALGSQAKPSISIRLRSRTDGAHFSLEMAPPPPALGDGWVTVSERVRALGGRFSIESDAERAAAFVYLPALGEQ